MWKLIWQTAKLGYRLRVVPLVDFSCRLVLWLRPNFWFARELPKHVRGHFSQDCQDTLIEQYFSAYPPRSKLFVEVGAYDGVHYSNVRRLYLTAGWTGVCIEPVDENFQRLVNNYKDSAVRCVKCAVGNMTGEVNLYISQYPHLPEWGSDVATIDKKNLCRWSDYAPLWHEQTVPIRTLTEILDEFGIQDFDLLSIDTEGSDLSVLDGLDFERFRPQLVLVEYGLQKQQIVALLHTYDYCLLHDNGTDLILYHMRQSVPDDN